MAKAAKATTTAKEPGWVDRLGALRPAEMDELRESFLDGGSATAAALEAVRARIGALAGRSEPELQTAWLQGVEAAYVLAGYLPTEDSFFIVEPSPAQLAFLAGLRGRSLRTSITEAMPLPGEPEGSAMTRGLRGMARRMRKGKK